MNYGFFEDSLFSLKRLIDFLKKLLEKWQKRENGPQIYDDNHGIYLSSFLLAFMPFRVQKGTQKRHPNCAGPSGCL